MSVLQALNEYYDRMAARGEAEPPGFSREKISFAVVLSSEGRAIDKFDLRELSKTGMRPRQIEVPAAVKRTVAISPNFLWDKTPYALGVTEGDGKRTVNEHAAFRNLHFRLLAETQDVGLLAFRKFLEQWSPENFQAAPFVADMLDTNVVFRLEGEHNFIHECDAAKLLVHQRDLREAPRAFCLITGMRAPVLRLHPTIKGVDGAQSSGAALVSFNLDAFTSYGHEQGDNAPTSEVAAFRYGAALNRLLDRATSRNRIKIGDATVAFWADASAGEDVAVEAETDFGNWFGASRNEDDKLARDESESVKLRDSLRSLAEGRPSAEASPALTKGVSFHVLGLAPNAARISVRYWLEDDFHVFAKHLNQHFDDIEIHPAPWQGKLPSIQRLLVKTTALQQKFENIPPLLAGECMRAILGGGPYPQALLAACVIRLRAGDDPGTGWHAAIARACINRALRKTQPRSRKAMPVSLDPHNSSEAYQLGRLFAVLESAQYAALGRVNAPISDRFYGAASATPARVFGPLMRSARTHISDAKKRGKGLWIESKLNEIVGRLPAQISTTLKLEDQAKFAIGYYHERAERFAKLETDPDSAEPASTEQETR